MLFRVMMILVLAMKAAQAQEAAVPAPSGAAALIEAMPPNRLKALKASPKRFLEDAAQVIYAAGRDGRIDVAGIETFIALRRADIRSGEMRLFLSADMDNDGSVGRDESGLFAGSLAARRRGEIQWRFQLADLDADGTVTMAELRSHAETVALDVLDETDAAGLRSLMLFDQDNDGAVTMDDVVSAVSSLQEK